MLKALLTIVIVCFMVANIVKILIDIKRVREAKKIYKDMNLIGKDK